MWLKSVLIGEFDSVEHAFETMETEAAQVTPSQFSSAIERTLSIKLAKYDLARILWSLDVDPSSQQPYSTHDWVARFAKIEHESLDAEVTGTNAEQDRVESAPASPVSEDDEPKIDGATQD